VKLLLTMSDPDVGATRVDGVDLRELDIAGRTSAMSQSSAVSSSSCARLSALAS
jgi:hypothetical protein